MIRNVLILGAIVLYIVAVSESQAATPDAGFCNDERTCLWKIDSAGTLTIYAKENETNVQMKNYYCLGYPNCPGNRPWETNINNIENIIIGNNIINVGYDAFQNAINLKTVIGMKDVKSISVDAFYGAKNLNYVMLPEGATVNFQAFLESGVPTCGKDGGACENCGDNYVKSGTGCVTAENCGIGYYADEQSKRCLYCQQGKVVYKGQCLDEYPFAKKRYTPAEAAQWLYKDNNTVTLTFKQQ